MDEFRWILLGLGLLLIGGIWWWGARRQDQAPGNAELREPVIENLRSAPPARDWGVPPLEPLNIRVAEFERVPVLDTPMLTDDAPPSAAAPPPAAAAAPASATAGAPASATAAERQKIVTIRVSAPGDARWPGAELMAALEQHGLSLGRYQVFHRNHVDGRSLFCVASLVEPGTFDGATMAEEEFRGVTLFAVLPGPLAPLETFDELIATARGLAEELPGMLQDAKGMALTGQRAAALREDVQRFQARLPTG